MSMVYAEPDERWKASLKCRIQENLDKLLVDAKVSFERKLADTAHNAPDAALRRRYYLDYLQDVQNLKTFAADEYQHSLERERQEMHWSLQATSEEWAWVLRDQQAAILTEIDISKSNLKADGGVQDSHIDNESTPCVILEDEKPVHLSPPVSPSLPSFSPSPSSPLLSLHRETPFIDEDTRIRAEKHAKQQEEFRKRAEDIKRRNQERRQLKQERWAAGSETSSSSSSDDGRSYFESHSFNSSTSSSSSSSSNTTSPPPKAPIGVTSMSEDDLIKLFIFHDQQWTLISSSTHALHWSDFPWPVLSPSGPIGEQDITQVSVSAYIFSAFDWQTDKVRSKERLKEHIRKWHPDRFEFKYLARVPEKEGERERVHHAAGMVVRFLCDLLGRFNNLHD